MTNSRKRRLGAALAAALAMVGCTGLEPRTGTTPARLTVQPVQVVRHGMSPEQSYRLARSLQDQGRDAEAIAALRQVILADPLHADAHNALGVILSLRGEAAGAESEFRLAIAAAPQAQYLKDNLALHLARREPPRAQPIEPPAPLAAQAPMPAPTVRLDRVAESVWQLRNGAFLQEVPAVKVAASAPVPVLAADPEPAARYRVEVSNGNGAAGLARRTSQRLPAAHLAGVRLTNHRPYGVVGSVIQHVAGAEQAAREVRGALPIDVPLARVDRLEREAAVRVLLGRDFPLGAPDAAAARLASR